MQCSNKITITIINMGRKFRGDGSSSNSSNTQVHWAEAYLHAKYQLDPSTRLATVNVGRKFGGSAPFWGRERGPHLTQSRMGRGLPPYQVGSLSMQPFRRNRYRPKIGELRPFGGAGAGSPSNTMRPGPRPTGTPSFI